MAPSNSDIAAANPLQPTASPSNNEQIQPTPSAMNPSTTPTAPNVSANIASNQALSNAQQTQAAAVKNASTPPTPADIHQSVFKNVLGVLAGGSKRPVLGPNGQPTTDANGNVIMQQASTKQLGASILAGAISALVAGMATPTQYQQLGGGRVIADNSGAVAAGANAAQPYTQKGAQAQAQGEVDSNQARQFATTDHNLKLHGALLNNLKLQGDILNEGVQQDAPLVDAMKLNPTITGPDGKTLSVIEGEHVSEDALMKMMKEDGANVTRDSILRDGVENVYDANGKPVLNPDGTPRQEYTYTVYDHNANVAMTDEMKKNNPNLKYVAQGTSVPIAVLAKSNREKMDMDNAQGFINQWSQQVADHNGRPVQQTDLDAEIAKAPYLRKLIPALGRYAGMEPDQAMAQMDKDGVDSALIGKFSNLFGGIDRNAWNQQRAEDMKKQLANDKSFTLDSAVDASTDASNPTRQQKAKKWLATYQAVQATIAGSKTTAETKAKDTGTSNFAAFNTPDALGFQPTADKFAGNEKDAIKQYNKVQAPFKKNADDLAKMEGTYQQFEDVLKDINAGKELTGAQSVVALFNAIGISAEPLAGKGFRINNNTVQEHANAISMPDSLVRKAVSVFQNGEVVTPQQIKDYANIALQTRQSKYVNLVNQAHNMGLNADFVLPTGNGEKIDAPTVGIFLKLAGGDVAKARAAATAKGWAF